MTGVMTFQLLDWSPPVDVHLRQDAVNDGLTKDLTIDFTAFKNWTRILKENLCKQMQSGPTYLEDPWALKEIIIHNVSFSSKHRIRYMTIEARLRRTNGIGEPKELNRIVFLRGGSVGMLMILRPRDSHLERYVIMTEQPRLGAGSMGFLEIPAGMLNDSPEVQGKVLEKIEEETGFTIQKDELIDLTELALRGVETADTVQEGMYPSPANLDEFFHLFVWEKELDRLEIEDLKSRLTGLRKHQDMITLVLCNYEDVWKRGARDAKTLAAWALYEGLSREGKIQDELYRIRTGRSMSEMAWS
ncbi:Nudix hydrolase 14 [Lasiodiplodia hormozganensis]|uniref:Nudix hydrolase 14 n=1 Tax=Lasiodiplodia hormozganensis TaxID=869390 RepID=A0AA39TQ58_9PEZI|nr:Nudix hydrolase 14 [Lasiodiplodia hormozganensis]